jgi:hypothetical protein
VTCAASPLATGAATVAGAGTSKDACGAPRAAGGCGGDLHCWREIFSRRHLAEIRAREDAPRSKRSGAAMHDATKHPCRRCSCFAMFPSDGKLRAHTRRVHPRPPPKKKAQKKKEKENQSKEEEAAPR